MDQVNQSNTFIQEHKDFRVIIFLLRLIGIPLFMENVSVAYRMYSFLANICTYATYIGIFMELITNRDQLGYSMAVLRVFIAMCASVWMHIYLSFSKSKFERLFNSMGNFTWEELPDRDSDTGDLTMAGMVRRISSTTKYMTVISFAYHVTQSIIRVVTNHEMVFKSWYPFDMYSSPMYEVMVFVQFLGSWVFTCVLYGFLGLYITFLSVACSQLEKLRANLLQIGQKQRQQDFVVELNETKESVQVSSTQYKFSHIQKRVNECIRHHQLILEFMQKLEDTWTICLCVLFFILMISLCLVAFSAVTSWGDVSDVLQAVGIYFLLMINVFVTCIFGDKLNKEAERVRDAAFGCEWVGTPVPFQRCIYFIIAKANQEFTITAGKFVPVCNKTMMNVMNQTLSFFMFLLQMRDLHIEEEHSNKKN